MHMHSSWPLEQPHPHLAGDHENHDNHDNSGTSHSSTQQDFVSYVGQKNLDFCNKVIFYSFTAAWGLYPAQVTWLWLSGHFKDPGLCTVLLIITNAVKSLPRTTETRVGERFSTGLGNARYCTTNWDPPAASVALEFVKAKICSRIVLR